MGLLSLEKEYDIKHTVAVFDEKKYGGKVICIGSPYIHDIIVINMQGEIIKRDDCKSNDNLLRYIQEFDKDPDKLKRIVTQEDDFSDFTTPVYITNHHRIRKEFCKEFGWPNITSSGELMYNNTCFKTYKEAFENLCRNIKYYFDEFYRENYYYNLKNDIKRVFKCIKFRWKDRFDFVYVNTILRIKSWFNNE